jgi:hypothetical protein
MYSRRRNLDQPIQEGYRESGEGEREERETRGAKTKSASERIEADKIDAVLQEKCRNNAIQEELIFSNIPVQHYKSY